MRDQLRFGRFRYISFVIIDLLCLIGANALATAIYWDIGKLWFKTTEYRVVFAYMLTIDLLATIAFSPLKGVLRRKIIMEAVECLKHVAICFVALTLLLFSIKQGATYSRATIYLTYGFDYIFILLCHVLWRAVLRRFRQKESTAETLLVTTDGYVDEGLGVVEKSGMTVRGVFVTDRTNDGLIRNIPIIVDRQQAVAFLSWEWIDKVYICGAENIDVPENVIATCKQFDIPVFKASPSKNLSYEVVKIRTALQKNDADTGLSFFEAEHDIPFRISRLYTIYESEQEKQRGFYAHKQSWHLLFCPYGSIDVIVDTGKKRETIALHAPSAGLILHPSVWREIIWKKQNSVLCVAASGHYETEKMIGDYDEYIKFLQERDWSAVIESAEIMGDY